MSSFTVLALASLIGAVTCGNGGSYVLPGNYGENNGQFVPSAVGPGQTSFSAIDFSSHFTDQSFRRNQNGGYNPRTVSYRASQPHFVQQNPTVVMPLAPRSNFRGLTEHAMHRQPYRQLTTRPKFNSAGANSYVAPGGYAGPGYETGIDQNPAPEGYVTAPDVNYEVEVEHSQLPEQPEQYGPKMPAPPHTYEEEQEETDSEYGSESTDPSTLPPPASGFAQTEYGSGGTSYMKRNVKVRSTGEREKRKGAQTA
ncbi:unnamed protein product [Auanema sp. JU1783]|nr:unnamed protein product [Auanema sp. JU1783]